MPASFLRIGGELVQDATLKTVLVTQQLNRHSFCEVECHQTADRRFPIEDLIGQDLQIVTFGQDGTEHAIFDGFLLEGELEYEIFGDYIARLKGVTRSHKLDVAEEEFYWRKQTLADIASALDQQAGVTQDLHCALTPTKNYLQWGKPRIRSSAGWPTSTWDGSGPRHRESKFSTASSREPRSSGAPKAA